MSFRGFILTNEEYKNIIAIIQGETEKFSGLERYQKLHIIKKGLNFCIMGEHLFLRYLSGAHRRVISLVNMTK